MTFAVFVRHHLNDADGGIGRAHLIASGLLGVLRLALAWLAPNVLGTVFYRIALFVI